ncbi:MAG: hypothetical protein K9K82_03555, partial [Desulfobacteraceae bacterium]|nr:hypothetical protein [Desulfobacteraceae bacterium]
GLSQPRFCRERPDYSKDTGPDWPKGKGEVNIMWALGIFIKQIISVFVLATVIYIVWRLVNPGKKW